MGAALSLIRVEENPGSALMFCDLQHAVPLYFCSLFFIFTNRKQASICQFGFHSYTDAHTLVEPDHVTHPCACSTLQCRSRCSFQSMPSPDSTAASCSRCLRKLCEKEKQTDKEKHLLYFYEGQINLRHIALTLISAIQSYWQHTFPMTYFP